MFVNQGNDVNLLSPEAGFWQFSAVAIFSSVEDFQTWQSCCLKAIIFAILYNFLILQCMLDGLIQGINIGEKEDGKVLLFC
jgi:hypothetical protein